LNWGVSDPTSWVLRFANFLQVPNTVLYFVTYEELKELAHRPSSQNEFLSPQIIPAFAGAAARLVASVATAPLELIR
jgi:hypothetical protein